MQLNPPQGDRGERNPRELVDGVRIGFDTIRRLKTRADGETQRASGLSVLSRYGEW